jgi:hypothetical protein
VFGERTDGSSNGIDPLKKLLVSAHHVDRCEARCRPRGVWRDEYCTKANQNNLHIYVGFVNSGKSIVSRSTVGREAVREENDHLWNARTTSVPEILQRDTESLVGVCSTVSELREILSNHLMELGLVREERTHKGRNGVVLDEADMNAAVGHRKRIDQLIGEVDKPLPVRLLGPLIWSDAAG